MRIRRAVSLILMLVFLLEAMPLHAIAEELYPEPPTAAEIEAWVEKSGTKEGAPGYIEGMDLSASMNAVQMACWIKYFRNSWLLGVMDSYQDVDGILAEKDPSQYPLFQKYYDQCTRLEIETGGVLESLEDCISQVSDYRSQIDDKMWDEAQREEYAFLLEEAGEEMEGLMQEVLDKAEQWEHEASDLDEAMLDIAKDIEMDENPVVAEAELPVTGAVRKDAATRLARLLPISSAIADTSRTMKIRVIDDKAFVIAVTADGKPLAGAQVTVKAKKSDAQKTAKTSDQGDAVFQIRDFNPDKDGEAAVSLTVSADGYRKISVPGVYVRKGNSFKVTMEKDDGTPYIYEWAYEDHDILNNDYGIVTSRLNDLDRTIRLRVFSKADYTLNVWYENKGKEKHYLAKDVKAKGDQTFTYKGKFSRDLLGEAKVCAEIAGADGKKVSRDSRLKVERAVIDKPLSFNDKSSVFDHTLSFTFPNSFPQPLKGSKVALEIPIAKIWPIDINVGQDGSGYIYIGAEETALAKQDTSDWRTKDKKEIDKLVKDAEKQGYFKQQRLKSGNDEAYKKRRFIGGVDFYLSFFYFAKLKYFRGDGDKGLLKLNGGAGIVGNVNAEIKVLLWGVIYFGVSFNLKSMAAPQLSLDITTSWPKGKTIPSIKKVEISKTNPLSLNATARLEIGVFVGVGAKGYVSVTATGYGFISFAWTIPGKNWLTVHAGFGARIVAQFFWAKWVKQLGDEIKWRLLPTPVQRAEAVPNLLERLIAFIGPSRAEAASEESKNDAVSVSLWNPNQIAKAEAIGGKDNVFTNNCSLVRIQVPGSPARNSDWLFYIGKDGNNRSTLYWKDPAQESSAQNIRDVLAGISNEAVKILNSRDIVDYTLQVVTPDHQHFLSNQPPIIRTSANGPDIKELLFITMVLSDGYTEMEYEYPAEDGKTMVKGKQTVPKETDYCVIAALIPEADGGKARLSFPELFIRDQYTGNDNWKKARPICSAVSLGKGRRLLSPKSEHLMRPSAYYLKTMFTPLEGDPIRNQVMIAGQEDYEHKNPKLKTVPAASEGKELGTDRFCGITAGYQAMSLMPDHCQEWLTEHWYGIAENKDKKRRLMIHTKKYVYYDGKPYTWKERGLLQLSEDGDDVLQYVLVKGGFKRREIFYEANDVLFYLVPEGKAGQARLKQAVVNIREDGALNERDGQPFVKKLALYDMNMTLPDTVLHYDKVLGNSLLWWIETTSENGKEESKENYWKVRGIWLGQDDSGACTVSPPFTMAMIKSEDKNKLPESIFFFDDSADSTKQSCYGYYVLTEEGKDKGTLYRFKYTQTVGMDIYGATLADTIAAAGSRDEMTVSVANNGSVCICAAEFGVYGKTSKGSTSKIETVYVDFRDETKNKLTIAETGKVWTGKDAARKTGNALWDKAVRTQMIKGWTWDAYEAKKGKQNVSKLLRLQGLPASNGDSFSTHLFIPRAWKTEVYNIEIRVEKIYVQARENLKAIPVRTAGNVPDARNRAAVFPDPAESKAGGNPLRMLAAAVPEQTGGAGEEEEKEEEDELLLFIPDGDSSRILKGDGSGTDVTDTYDDVFSLDAFYDTFEMDSDEHDLQLDYDLWSDDGTETVTFYIHEPASMDSRETVWLKAWAEEEEEPCFAMLLTGRVKDRGITDELTWNIDIPLEELTDNKKPAYITVAVIGDEETEAASFDNEVVIWLGTNEFVIVQQPGDVTVYEKKDASFQVGVSGGRKPYTYQWQVLGRNGKWEDLEDGVYPELVLTGVTLEMNGNRYRCIIYDANGTDLVTREAKLKVLKDVPNTGDSMPVGGTAMMILLGMGALLFLGITERKRRRNR